MRTTAVRLVFTLALLGACGSGDDPSPADEPGPSPSDQETPASAEATSDSERSETEEAPVDVEPEPEPEPPPTEAEISVAREACNLAWTRFNASGLGEGEDRPAVAIDRALRVLREGEGDAHQSVLGACLYNRGRVAEEELELQTARDVYTESLAARPNAVVRRRLGALGTRSMVVDESRDERIAGMLRRDEHSPCESRCEIEVLAAADSGARRLLRTAVVGVDTSESEGALYAAWGGPTGTYHWGPRLDEGFIGHASESGEFSVEASPRPLRPGEPWHLVARVERTWSDLPSRSLGSVTHVVICELGETEARCVRIVEQENCEQEEGAAGVGDGSGDYNRTNRIHFSAEGVDVTGDAGAGAGEGGLERLEAGMHAWDEVFPPEPALAEGEASAERSETETVADGVPASE